jgi:hypothetical protein
MNAQSQWRFELAQRIANAYATIPSAEVIMIAGSTGRGTADRFSDIEIDVYYAEWPSLAQRQAAVAACGGDSAEFSTFDESDVELSESMFFNGFYVHTSTFLVAQMNRWIQKVTVEGDPDSEGQMRMNSVLASQTVVGQEQIARWQAAARRYPDTLAHRMLADSLDFSDFYYLADMVAYRNDTLLLNKVLLQNARQLLLALHGLNRVYLPTPDAMKWLDETVAALALRPERLADRLRRLFRVDSAESIRHMNNLIDDTFALIASNAPDFDLSLYSKTNFQIRRAFDKSPQ